MFSSAYTAYQITPHEARPGRPREFTMDLTIRAVLDLDWNDAGRPTAERTITRALNQFAGGRRMFRHTPVDVRWHLVWDANRSSQKSLKIAFMPRDLLLAAGEGGVFVLTIDGFGTRIGRVLLPAEGLAAHGSRRPGSPRDAFGRVIAHEFGHALGLPDDRGDRRTIMYFRELNPRQLRRISQHWTDQELRTALQGLFARPADLPPWLNS